MKQAENVYGWDKWYISFEKNVVWNYDNQPIILYRDNAAYIVHLKRGFINGDRTKHILPKIFLHAWATKEWW